jgi:hypothetical protein
VKFKLSFSRLYVVPLEVTIVATLLQFTTLASICWRSAIAPKPMEYIPSLMCSLNPFVVLNFLLQRSHFITCSGIFSGLVYSVHLPLCAALWLCNLECELKNTPQSEQLLQDSRSIFSIRRDGDLYFQLTVLDVRIVVPSSGKPSPAGVAFFC